LSDISGIDRKFIGELTMQKNCSFFNVDNTQDKGISDRFKGIEIEGRSIRVNRDDDGGNKRQRIFSSKKREGRHNRSKNNSRKKREKRRR